MMLTGQADVLQATSHAIPRADATQPAGDVPAAVCARVLSVVHRRAGGDAGEDGAVDGPCNDDYPAGAGTRHDPDSRRARLAAHRLSLAQDLHLALPPR